MSQVVRQFRQILIWPLQVMPIREGAQIQEPWDILRRTQGSHSWHELKEEIGRNPEHFAERHYSEFVTFLPYVRSFLYGEGAGRGRTGGSAESPLRVFRRNDVARVRVTFPESDVAEEFGVAHVDLVFLYDVDIMLLVVELYAQDLPLRRAQDLMYRFGRAYPTFWTDGRGGHCVELAEWLARDGSVLARSDYEQRDVYLRYVANHRAPHIATHWAWLLEPLVQDNSDREGAIRYRQIEYGRMPLMAYLAVDDARALTRADFVRLGLVTGAGASEVMPYSDRYTRGFEERYCYDQFWNEQREGPPGTRFMACGHAFVMVGQASDPFFVDSNAGLFGQFCHQYFLLFLIPHMHKAALLMLSDRMVNALNKLSIDDPDSIRRFKRTIRQLFEIFLRFTHRYWFHEISDQPQARELYRMTSRYLGTDRLFDEIRDEIEDMSGYLETDTLRRQANTVVRLTVVTVFGMIGTIVTGIFGMNLFGFAELGLHWQVIALAVITVGVTVLLFATLAKSKRLADFLDAVADERVGARGKVDSFIAVWRTRASRRGRTHEPL